MENRIKSVFGDYSTQLQVLVNNNLDKFKEPFYPKYFSMGAPQTGLTYATAVGRTRIEAAASVVAHGSEAPLRSRAGLEKYSGEVASIKVKRKMDESEYRNLMAVQAMQLPDEGKKQQLIQLIWDDVKHVVDAVRSRVDIMVKQALSTGNVIINLANNPDGIIPGTINLLVGSTDNSGNPGSRNGTTAAFGNTGTGTRWDGGDADVIADIATVSEMGEDNGIAYEKVLMTPTQWRQVASRRATVAALGAQPTLDEMNNYLSDRLLPTIELVPGRHSVETNGEITNLVAWNNARVVFVPGGNLGLIHNALGVGEIRPVPTVDYALAGRTLVSKWAQTEPFGEFTRGEIAAFPGLEVADSMLVVNVESDTWA